jgi:hypothetical protein
VPIEFVGIAATNDGFEMTPRSGPSFDKRLGRAHEDWGWDRVLFAYGSGSPEPSAAAAYLLSHTERLQVLLAHRPNVSYPTFAAKTFATLDRIGDGRLTVHFITGGTDAEQRREGDHLTEDQRYARTREYIQIVEKAWTSHEPFDWDGEHYRFADFVSDTFPVQQPRPDVSFGRVVDVVDVGAGLLGWGDPAVGEAVAALRAAEVAVVASPTYKATYTGLLKLFLDQVGTGDLAGVVAVPFMLGAGPAHALAPDLLLKPVLVELGATTPTRGLYLLDRTWDAPGPLEDWLAAAGPQVAAARTAGRR